MATVEEKKRTGYRVPDDGIGRECCRCYKPAVWGETVPLSTGSVAFYYCDRHWGAPSCGGGLSPKQRTAPFCKPWCAGLNSEPRAVARRLSNLLTALGYIDSSTVEGTLPDELRDFRISLHERLKAEGWRITGTRDGWKVLPPKAPRKR